MKALKLSILTICLAYASMCLSQSSTTSVRGTVTDIQGGILAGATVDLVDASANVHRSVQADAKGEYEFTQLVPGSYTITGKSDGFTSVAKTIELLISQPATVSFALDIKSTTETVTVSAESPTLNTTDATIGNAVDHATVDALPIEGRNVPDLLSLQPGVLYLGHGPNINQNEDSRTGAVAGSRADQGNITLDGMDDNTELSGYAFTGTLRSTLDSVEEFRVTTTGGNSDAGRSSGAQVNIMTRSGTDSLRGSLYEYNRDTFTAANDWFNKAAEATQGLPNKAGKLIRNTFGATIGGPIIKKKLFYFLNYEAQRTAENAQTTQTVPTALYRTGVIQYTNTSGTTTALTPAQFATMDPRCFAAGVCPWGPGVDPNFLPIAQAFPLPNGSASGDGLNTASFTWSAPNPLDLSTYIAKIDYIISDKNRLYVRGNLQGDKSLSPPYFPGQLPSDTHTDNTKGVTVGDTHTFSDHLINGAHWAYIRQGYSDRGAGSGSYVNLSGLTPSAETRSTLVNIPVQNFTDDLTWLKHDHTFQFGANWRIIQANRSTDLNSYYTAATSGEYDSALAGTGQSLDPDVFGFPRVASSFVTSYSGAAMALAGPIASYTLQYNYHANPGGTGTLLPVGAMEATGFKSNEVEYYLQDSWRVRKDLTITYGIRHSILQTPYEVNGQQVQPTVDVEQWFNTRLQQGALGNTVQPPFSFSPSGKANGGKPFWPMSWKNFAPRIAFAYSPDSKTSIRGGFGIYFDHFGQGVVGSFSQLGSYGLTGKNATAANFAGPDNAPRFTGLQNFPPIPSGVTIPAASITYPYTAPVNGQAGASALDDHMRTPYSYAFNLSVQRELPKGFLIETSYVGRIGVHLLQQRDLGTVLDLVDPKSGMDYYTAASLIDKQIYACGAIPAACTASIQPIPYWEDLFPDAAGLDAAGTGKIGNTATQNIYNAYSANPKDSTIIINSMDLKCNPGCGGQEGRYFDRQFTSLFAWSSIGNSSYNAGQITVRHAMSHGLQVDGTYTLAKSIDLGSDTERTCINCSTLSTAATGYIINVYNPSLNRGVSDFDVRHNITADWVYRLPFGQGQLLMRSANRWVQGVVGGWQLSGIVRRTSGLPFTIKLGPGQVTDWHEASNVVVTGKIAMHRHIINGSPNAFADPVGLNTALTNSFLPGGGVPIRYPLPGESGTRNPVRGDGYFGIDSGLTKSWQPGERQSLRFTWEVFNVTNSVRFDVLGTTGGIVNSIQSSGYFGNYGHMLIQPRIQQMSLRYSF